MQIKAEYNQLLEMAAADGVRVPCAPMAPIIYVWASKGIFFVGMEISAKFCSSVSHHVMY
jgi:hypothetical protein